MFDWPADGKLSLAGLKSEIVKAQLLAKPDAKVAIGKDASGAPVIELGSEAPDAIASVVAVDIKGTPVIE